MIRLSRAVTSAASRPKLADNQAANPVGSGIVNHPRVPAGGAARSTGTLFSVFEPACPEDFPTPGGEAQRKFGMSGLGMDKVHRTKPQWCILFPIAQL